ncbi:MAG: cytochrome c [Alphaproteobacteria bacterium]|jgi:mono/diheme cytochrome c family protein|nr:cytochrome c [Reyranella sp.]MBL6940056.1 cytochrome c [Alphaproteobacteria bacterium]MBL7100143.1 cytochrome c [Alphaproteobacteria bacterium]
MAWSIKNMTRNRLIGAVIGGGLVAVLGAAWIIIYAGAYNIAADAPHTGPVYWLLKTVRERSILVRSADIPVPTDLGLEPRVASGAALYKEMCTACHLAPGTEKTELSQGLYPPAPALRDSKLSAEQQFWVIKHGIKMSAMPAWGVTHNDKLIWDMVAFLRKLPSLTPAEYERLSKLAPDHDDAMKGMNMDGAMPSPTTH